jgi:hypothetical protein
MLKKGLIILFVLVLTLSASAQRIGESQWFFGSSAANMQFDKNGIMVYEEERMNPVFGTGGPAVVNN